MLTNIRRSLEVSRTHLARLVVSQTEEEAKIIVEYTRINNGLKILSYMDVDEKI